MAEYPALNLWTDSYLADTMHLSCLESGAYLHLLMAAWRSPDCMIPNDDRALARMAKCTPREWRKVRAAVMAFWTFDDGSQKWFQKRLIRERQLARDRSEKAKLAAKSKWRKTKESDDANASGEHTTEHCPGDASIDHSPLTTEEGERIKDDSLSRPRQTEDAGAPVPMQRMVDVWNMMAKEAGLSRVKEINETRRRHLRARFTNECHNDFEVWCHAVQKVGKSDFCRGNGPRAWKAGIDFLLQPSSFVKVLEGQYDNNKPGGGGSRIHGVM